MKQIKNTEQKTNRIYGIIGMVVLFLIGIAVGYIVNSANNTSHSVMSKEELPDTTCGRIEKLLLERLHSVDNQHPEVHIDNAKIYANLSEKGCPENSEKYKNLAKQEQEIADALQAQEMEGMRDIQTEQLSTCQKIEVVLIDKLYCSARNCNANEHIDNAKIYANLSERGCPENSEKYKNLAKQELEIARALNDDDLGYREDSIEIVETYKRLQMQVEAERMIEKAKKIANPAIDFIIQLEKIIEE